mmetsp:Transcript_31084/g.101313  ORF Transcript_31084/g.101313 Transcript_31084/m.101313 type:complete len:168 (+) Transcript_31084:1563-2066(+)
MGSGGNKVNEDDSAVVLKKLALLLPSFYASFYVCGAVYLAAFGLPVEDELPLLPFRWSERDFEPSLRDSGEPRRAAPLAAWLGLVTTFIVLGTVLCFAIVRCTRKAWDYACTVGFVHFVLTCVVNVAFPTNWIWWVTLAGSTFLLSTGGELSIYYLHDMREIELDHD